MVGFCFCDKFWYKEILKCLRVGIWKMELHHWSFERVTKEQQKLKARLTLDSTNAILHDPAGPQLCDVWSSLQDSYVLPSHITLTIQC